MRAILLFTTLFFLSTNILAQKQNFDVVSFSIPKGWQEKKFDGGLQYSITDKQSGGYAIVLITKATASNASATENFNADWNRMVKAAVQVNDEPAMLDPTSQNGWEIISGTANYTDGNQNGLATLLTATGGGQMTSVLLMTNTDKYQQELLSFINSLKLSKVLQSQNNNSTQPSKPETNKTSIVGLWVDYMLETTGYYINNQPQYTAGYLRKEYAFYPDGTYQFRNKQWLTKASDIMFVYETGTYQLSGNQLTLTPKTGKGGFWEKTSSSKEWGKLKKNYDYKLEKTTYSFEIKYFEGSDSYRIDLKTVKPTQRDGGKFNAPNDPFEFRYNFRKLESMVDNPPGWKTGFENKSFTSSKNVASNSNASVAQVNSPLSGKIWEAKTYEKQGAAYGNSSGFHTGGFWKYQYTFNTNGSYQFVYSAASALATNPVQLLQYESGTYSINGNQITITPLKGTNEEWSVGKVNNGMSAELIRKTLENRLKKLKTAARKLEKVSYNFSVEYWQGNQANALCLKHTQNTVREGSPGANNQSCFFETAPGKAEKFTALFM